MPKDIDKTPESENTSLVKSSSAERSPSARRTSSKRSSTRKRTGKSSSKRRRRKRSVGMIILLSLRNVFVALIVIMLLIGLIIAGIVAGALFGYVETIDPIDISTIKLNMTSFVYGIDADGNIIELEMLYDTENRIWVDLDEIPDDLQNAFISIEDERFWTHKGVDVKRTLGAAVTYVRNKVVGSNERTFGGSTITQQLIKNLTGEDEYSSERKIQEIYQAFKLEDTLTKQEILEYYLNTIYLGQRCNGVSSAANTYFGKPVSELDLAECALIAGITQNPSKYDLYSHFDNCKSRQKVVLGKMLELGKITQSQYDKALDEEIRLVPRQTEETISYQSYYVDATIDQIIGDLMDQYGYTRDIASRVLYNGGLKIYLAQDMEIQKIMDEVYADDSSFPQGKGEVQPESAMVIMDPYTGQVKALVGGRGDKEGNRTLNRATQSLRQPGSTIKPIGVYGPAIEYGLITPSTTINDAPVTYDGWSPKNVDKRFKGNVSVRSALANSRNVPAVKVCRYLGEDNVFKYLTERMHISSLVEYDERNGKSFSDKGLASLALGGLTDGVSVLELTAAYCSFVNDGFYNRPTLYTQVLDVNGNVILSGSPTHEIAMSEKTAADVISMMKDVVSYGSGTMANFKGMEIAGKTGTTGTSTSNDRWFVGCTPYYVGAVWFGYDKPQNLSGFSSNPAALAWKKVMQPVHENLEYRNFEAPGNTVSVMVCRESGQRANPDCMHVTSEMYSSNKIPKTRCELHPLSTGSKSVLSEGRNYDDDAKDKDKDKDEESKDNDGDKDTSSDADKNNESSGNGDDGSSSANNDRPSGGDTPSGNGENSGNNGNNSGNSSSGDSGNSSGGDHSGDTPMVSEGGF